MRTETKAVNQDKRVLMLLIAALFLINMGLALVAFSGHLGTPSLADGYGVRISDAGLSWTNQPTKTTSRLM